MFSSTPSTNTTFGEQNDVPLVVIELEENSTTACRELGE
ncbi:hypothetical protein GYH30_038012 [Glycine max]|nr:hypothetical protein GYH30_038012 [Glycine max]